MSLDILTLFGSSLPTSTCPIAPGPTDDRKKTKPEVKDNRRTHPEKETKVHGGRRDPFSVVDGDVEIPRIEQDKPKISSLDDIKVLLDEKEVPGGRSGS